MTLPARGEIYAPGLDKRLRICVYSPSRRLAPQTPRAGDNGFSLEKLPTVTYTTSAASQPIGTGIHKSRRAKVK